jgi:hypothetical protein
MRQPAKIQLRPPPPHQWELRLPGTPFEVHVCDNGRWVIVTGRDSIGYGCESGRDRAAEVAGNVLLGWAKGIIGLAEAEADESKVETMPPPAATKPVVEESKPFEHPMAASKSKKR